MFDDDDDDDGWMVAARRYDDVYVSGGCRCPIHKSCAAKSALLLVMVAYCHGAEQGVLLQP